MHFHIGLAEFLVFACYYFILKGLLIVVNLETRRAGIKVPAAVTGLLA
jgi:hypothetical protein